MQLKKEIKFETLKKSHKKQIVIGVVIVLLVVSTITLTMSKSKYRLTQSMKLVTGTINYKVPDLRIVAIKTSEDGTNYEIVNDIPESGYILNEEKSMCKVATETSGIENAPKDENITIKYENNKISFYGITKKSTRCYLYFDKKVTSETTIAKLNINSSYIKTGDPNFAVAATGAETEENNGIYKTADPMYGENAETYYWRGAATSNHVIFANKCWRIVRINGDGSIRLIYNGAIGTGNTCKGNGINGSSIAKTFQVYYTSANHSEYVGYTYTAKSQRPVSSSSETESSLKKQTDKWFNENITNNIEYKNKTTAGKFCNDRNVESGKEWSSTGGLFYYAAKERLVDNKIPTLSCDSSDIYMLEAGIITADEVLFAGAFSKNNAYYLYNGQQYWTMTPYYFGNEEAIMFYVGNSGTLGYSNGKVSNSSDNSKSFGLRPVINLRNDVTFTTKDGEKGTITNPYVVQ